MVIQLSMPISLWNHLPGNQTELKNWGLIIKTTHSYHPKPKLSQSVVHCRSWLLSLITFLHSNANTLFFIFCSYLYFLLLKIQKLVHNILLKLVKWCSEGNNVLRNMVEGWGKKEFMHRNTHKDTHRPTHRCTHREKHTEKHWHTHRDTHRDIHIGTYTNTHRDTHRGTQIHRHK